MKSLSQQSVRVHAQTHRNTHQHVRSQACMQSPDTEQTAVNSFADKKQELKSCGLVWGRGLFHQHRLWLVCLSTALSSDWSLQGEEFKLSKEISAVRSVSTQLKDGAVCGLLFDACLITSELLLSPLSYDWYPSVISVRMVTWHEISWKVICSAWFVLLFSKISSWLPDSGLIPAMCGKSIFWWSHFRKHKLKCGIILRYLTWHLLKKVLSIVDSKLDLLVSCYSVIFQASLHLHWAFLWDWWVKIQRKSGKHHDKNQ